MKSLQIRVAGKIAHFKATLLTPRFPRISYHEGITVQGLGSEYGRKFFSTNLRDKPLLVSGGVGEDISFDVEFISQYGAKVYLFDPTPRAIQHIMEVNRRFGTTSECSYSKTGKQPANSYDLRLVNPKNLMLKEFALLESAKTVKFYEPPVPDHVSYSVQNIQNHFHSKGSYIEVQALGPQEVVQLTGTNYIDVLKLDIEGSEYLYLSSSFEKGIFPKQVLIEIDELHFPSLQSRSIAKKIFRLFEQYDYILIYIDGYNFTYVRSNSI
jgi:hypothetical protein